MAEQRMAKIGPLVLESGGVIEDCTVGYRVFGELNQHRSNVLISPTWYGGTTQGMIDLGVIGPGMYADTDNYHVIAIDALGNGVSSSPSHYSGNAMPEITVRDMVNSQYQLLTKILGFDRVNTVLGISMGGMQTYEWITGYPVFMTNAVAVIGTPKPSAADVFLWNFWRELAIALCELPDGERRANKLMSQAQGLAAFTPGFINASCKGDDPAVVRDQSAIDHAVLNSFNEIAQLQAMLSHDISRHDEGSLTRAATRIKARLLTVTSRQDLTVSPARPAEFARDTQTPHVEIDGLMGHFTVVDEVQMPIALEAIHRFLSEV